MMALAPQREILDDAEVQIRERRLPKCIACGHRTMDDCAVVPVVRIVLRVKSDDGVVRPGGACHKKRVELEPSRQIEDRTQVEDVTRVLCGKRTLGTQVIGIDGKVQAVRASVGIIVARTREGVIDYQLRAARYLRGCSKKAAIVGRMRGRLIDQKTPHGPYRRVPWEKR